MPRGKGSSKRQYKRPNRRLAQPKLSPLLPQNTLLELPDELHVDIVSRAVTQPRPIRACDLDSVFLRLVKPLAASDHLLAMAEAELYNHNTFLEEHMTVRTSPSGKLFLPSCFKAIDRPLIKHLHVHFELKLEGGEVDLACNPRPGWHGVNAVLVLESLDEVYPNLRSLQVDLTIEPSEWKHVVYMPVNASGRAVHSAELRAWELEGTVRNVAKAFSEYESSELKEKALTLNQAPETRHGDHGGGTELALDGTDHLDETVWSMMDLPLSRLRLS